MNCVWICSMDFSKRETKKKKKTSEKKSVTKRGAGAPAFFATFLRRPSPAVKFRLFFVPINCPWVSEDGFVFTVLALNVHIPQQVFTLPELLTNKNGTVS